LGQRQIVGEAVGGELAGDPRAVVDREAARRELVRAHPVADDEVAPDLLADAGDDLARKAQPVLEAAAVGVAALVAERRDELLDHMALGTADLPAVAATVPGVARRAE